MKLLASVAILSSCLFANAQFSVKVQPVTNVGGHLLIDASLIEEGGLDRSRELAKRKELLSNKFAVKPRAAEIYTAILGAYKLDDVLLIRV